MCYAKTSLSCDKYKGFIAFKVAKDDGSRLLHAKVLQQLTTCDVDNGTSVDMATLPQDSKPIVKLSTEGQVYSLDIDIIRRLSLRKYTLSE